MQDSKRILLAYEWDINDNPGLVNSQFKNRPGINLTRDLSPFGGPSPHDSHIRVPVVGAGHTWESETLAVAKMSETSRKEINGFV